VRPLIGVTHSLDRKRNGEIIDEPKAYVAALERAGAQAEPLENDLTRLDEYLARLDGVVLSGGLDVAPERYGGSRDESVDPPNGARDEFEIALVRAARERGVPVFAICRGLQIANVAFGGTLFEDIPNHRDVSHGVQVASGSLLRDLAGEQPLTNSYHHQSARAVAPDLVAVAHAEDGTIEALEARFDHPFFLAVQWHPELLAADPVSQRLFERFVTRSTARRSLERA
jgi:putative glutamine amidotransferase